MRIPYAAQSRLRLGVLLAFAGSCALIFAYLWVNMGGTIPVVTSDGYRVMVPIKDANNLVFDSDIRVAGVPVGKVRGIEVEEGAAQVTLQFDKDAVIPLHEGVTVHLRAKSLVEETYLEIVDGEGAEIPDGGSLPADSVAEPVQLHDLLNSLGPRTRDALGRTLRALGAGTRGSEKDIAGIVEGLGAMGAEGHDVIDAIAAQSEDLDDMTRALGAVMASLHQRQGEVVRLVESAQDLTSVTTQNQEALAETMRRLPGVLNTVRVATDDVTELSGTLAPIASDLRAAAPALSRALRQLPATTRDLSGLVPSLTAVLDRAPATLTRTPALAEDISAAVPAARVALADLNPMLGYLAPYHRDLTAFFTNWTAIMANSDANGHYLRVLLVFNETSLKGVPLGTHSGIFDKRNSYPPPGGALNPGPFEGDYPRVKENPE